MNIILKDQNLTMLEGMDNNLMRMGMFESFDEEIARAFISACDVISDEIAEALLAVQS